MNTSGVAYNSQALTTQFSLQNDLYESGKKFVKFIGKNFLNLTGCAIGTALLINQWTVSGTFFVAATSFNLISNAAASQTWIPRSIRQFIVEKGGVIVGVATALALIVTNSHVLGISLLLYSTYNFADKLGLIPRDVSLFMERYFSWRALPACALVNTSPMGLFNFASLFTYVRPVERFLYEKFDIIVHKIWNVESPDIEEITAPYDSNPQLSFAQIKEVLKADDKDYVLDVRHCSHGVCSTVSLEDKDEHFEKLLTLAKTFSWSNSCPVIFAHSSFQTFLREEFPDVDNEDLKKRPHFYARQLAMAKGLSTPAYADVWLKARFTNVVDFLNGKIAHRVKGSQSELDDAIMDAAKILPYLEKIKNSTDVSHQLESQSILFSLALYTSSLKSGDLRAITRQILHEITKKHWKKASPTDHNLAKRYEFKVRSALQDARLSTIQSIIKNTEDDFTRLKDFLFPPSKEDLEKAKAAKSSNSALQQIEDSALLGLHRHYLSFGFLPLDTYDRENSVVPLHYCAKICNRLFNYIINKTPPPSIYETYKKKIDSDLIKSDKEEFWSYIQHILSSNQLTVDEQFEIQKLYQEQHRSDAAMQKNFRRLLLVSLGIMKKAA